MSAKIVSLPDYRKTRNIDASLAAWARRLQKQILENMPPDEREEFLARVEDRRAGRNSGGAA